LELNIKYQTQTIVEEPKLEHFISSKSVENLFNQSTQTLILSALVTILMFFGLKGYIEENHLNIWLFASLAITLLRAFHVIYVKKNALAKSLIDLKAYSIGAFFGGLSWAYLVFFYTPELPLILQVFILVTLVGMPAASLSTNANHFAVYTSFSTPPFIALTYWAAFISPDLNLYFFLIALSYIFLIMTAAYKLHKNLRQNIKSHLINEQLVIKVNEINNELTNLAYNDSLTGIPNRRHFIEKTQEHLGAIETEGSGHILFMLIDLDKFKEVNDTFGHDTGDQYLITIAQRLQKFVEQHQAKYAHHSEFARLGGDEFIVLYHIKDKTMDINTLCNELLHELNRPMQLANQSFNPSPSIGIVESSAQTHVELNKLLKLADMSMYKAKQNGGNQFFFCNQPYDTAVEHL